MKKKRFHIVVYSANANGRSYDFSSISALLVGCRTMPIETNKNTHVARPFLVLYRSKKNNRWFIAAFRTLKEAEIKSTSILRREIAPMTLVCRCLFDEKPL